MSRRAQMSECGGARIRRGVCGREVCLKAIVTRPDVVIALLHAKLAWTHVMAISTASSSDRCKLIVYTVLYGAFAPWLCHHPPAGFFNNRKCAKVVPAGPQGTSSQPLHIQVHAASTTLD
jgi:hypothetical protein